MFTLAALNDKAPSIGESVDIQVRFEGTKHKARLKRSQDEKDYIVDFKENDSLAQVLNELAGKAPERSKKTLKIAYAGNKIIDLWATS